MLKILGPPSQESAFKYLVIFKFHLPNAHGTFAARKKFTVPKAFPPVGGPECPCKKKDLLFFKTLL